MKQKRDYKLQEQPDLSRCLYPRDETHPIIIISFVTQAVILRLPARDILITVHSAKGLRTTESQSLGLTMGTCKTRELVEYRKDTEIFPCACKKRSHSALDSHHKTHRQLALSDDKQEVKGTTSPLSLHQNLTQPQYAVCDLQQYPRRSKESRLSLRRDARSGA